MQGYRRDGNSPISSSLIGMKRAHRQPVMLRVLPARVCASFSCGHVSNARARIDARMRDEFANLSGITFA